MTPAETAPGDPARDDRSASDQGGPAGSTERPLSERYGRPPRGSSRRWKIVAAAIAAGVALGWVVWAAWGQSHDSVGALVQSFRVTSPHDVRVTIQVSRTSSQAVQCTVSALATDHSQVGQSLVSIPAGPSSTRVVTIVVKTERLATSADVADCH